jgi:hypothetical protein
MSQQEFEETLDFNFNNDPEQMDDEIIEDEDVEDVETEDEEDPGWSIDDMNFYDSELEAEEDEDDSEIEEEDIYDNTFDIE